MSEAILLRCQNGNWEGLYLNGVLEAENHGLADPRFWMDLGKEHQLYGCELIIEELTDEDDEYVMDCGNLPQLLKDLKGNYGRSNILNTEP